MSDKGIVAAVIAILAAGGTGAYLISRKPTSTTPSSTTPPSNNYAITLNGPTSANVNSQETYNGAVTLNGSPVANTTVSFSVNNGTPQTTTTDSNGNYSFNVTFSNSGTITLNASSNGASASLAVTVTKTVSTYKITLSGPTTSYENTQETYSGNVTVDGLPFPETSVSITINGQSPITTTTDLLGKYSFKVSFTQAGTYTLVASSNGASSSLTVNVSSSTPPPPTCTTCSDCPPGYNCVNGQCVQLIPQSISVPVDYYVPSGYVQFTRLQNYDPPDPFPVSSKTTLVVSTTNAKSCPSPYGGVSESDSYDITISIKGSVIDASGRGVSGIDVSGNISGGGSWQVDTSGGTFSGNATPSLESASATTDCNGNFTFTIKVSITVKYAHNEFANYNTSYYNMGLQSLTLSVSSGALPSATTIISFDEYVAAELCNYIYGAIS